VGVNLKVLWFYERYFAGVSADIPGMSFSSCLSAAGGCMFGKRYLIKPIILYNPGEPFYAGIFLVRIWV